MTSPIDDLPQTGPARLVTRAAAPESGVACYARVPADSPFRALDPRGGSVPALIAIEMAAQAAAVLEPRTEGGAPSEDSTRLLVGIRASRLHVPVIDGDQEYLCKVTPLTCSPPLRIYRFEVNGPGDSPVAEGELSTFYGDAPE